MSGAAPNPEPLRVLVVDDTPDLRDLLTMALERTGEFEVVAHAENGQRRWPRPPRRNPTSCSSTSRCR